jgi:CheY-like chemotaxis protein
MTKPSGAVRISQIPRRAPGRENSMGSERETSPSGGFPITRKLAVLCVEDTDEDAAVIRRQLGDTAIVHIVETLSAALATLRHARFDVVLLDLALPDARDLESVESIHRITDTPIVILTGKFDIGDRFLVFQQRAVNAGADDYILKGASAFDLKSRIRLAIARRYRLQAEKLLQCGAIKP